MIIPKSLGLPERIQDHEVFRDAWARAYLDLLQALDPIENWAELVPLEEPLLPQVADYSYDQQTVARLVHVAPALERLAAEVFDGSHRANLVGWRHSYTRSVQQGHLLSSIRELYEHRPPSMVIEVGPYTGGLIHFLARRWSRTPIVTFDTCPVALDVCSEMAKRMELANAPYWLEGNFALVDPDSLPDQLGSQVDGALVIMGNVIEYLSQTIAPFPSSDAWGAKGRLISYWVNQGATVLLAGSHDDPEQLRFTLADNGRWIEGCTHRLLRDFPSPLTAGIDVEHPLGTEWEESRSHVIGFFPPKPPTTINEVTGPIAG